MSDASYNHLMPDDPPQKPIGWGSSAPDAQAIFNAWFQGAENGDTYIPLDAQDSLVAAFASALTEQAREIEQLRLVNAALSVRVAALEAPAAYAMSPVEPADCPVPASRIGHVGRGTP